MSKSLVGVSISTDPTMIDYVENQLQAISNAFPEVATQHVNENNPIMERFARYPNRFPAFIILKNGARMAVLQAKIPEPEFIQWFIDRSG